MNWKRLTFDDPDLVGRNILVKSGRDGKTFFCGRLRQRQRRDKTLYICDYSGAYHYFRKETEYYYVNIDEIK